MPAILTLVVHLTAFAIGTWTKQCYRRRFSTSLLVWKSVDTNATKFVLVWHLQVLIYRNIWLVCLIWTWLLIHLVKFTKEGHDLYVRLAVIDLGKYILLWYQEYFFGLSINLQEYFSCICCRGDEKDKRKTQRFDRWSYRADCSGDYLICVFFSTASGEEKQKQQLQKVN